MEDSIQQSLDKVECWLDKQGFVVCKSSKKTIEDEVDFERKVVFLSLRSKPLYQLYSILHECGHVILRKKKDYKKRFANALAIKESFRDQTVSSSIEQIEEEILAWREGEKLAISIGVEIDRDKYYKYGFRWVMGYVVLASIGREHFI